MASFLAAQKGPAGR